MIAPEVGNTTRPRSSGLADGRTRHTDACVAAAQGTGRVSGPYRRHLAFLDPSGTYTAATACWSVACTDRFVYSRWLTRELCALSRLAHDEP